MHYTLPRIPSASHAHAAIRQLLKARELRTARVRCSQLLALNPQDAEAWHLDGLACLLAGRADEAEPRLRHARALAPDSTRMLANHAEALRQLGQFAEARALLQKATETSPADPQAWTNLVSSEQALGLHHAAMDSIERAMALRPSAGLIALRADSLRALGRADAARAEYLCALALEPELFGARLNLGLLCLQCARHAEAIAHLGHCVRRQPSHVLAVRSLAQAQFQAGQPTLALQTLDAAIGIDPRAEWLLLRVQLLLELSQGTAAEQAAREAASLHPGDPTVLSALASVLRRQGKFSEAGEALDAIASEHCGWQVQAERARLYWDLGNSQAALSCFASALDRAPEQTALRIEYAQLLDSAGQSEAARQAYRCVLDSEPERASALHGLAYGLRGKIDPGTFETLQRLSGQPGQSDGTLALLHNALAQVHDGRGEFAQAAAAASRAKHHYAQLKSARGWLWDSGANHDWVRRACELFDAAWQARQHSPCSDARPCFIVGFPRSGTTLLERMLAAHPDVLGVGERGFVEHGWQQLPRLLGGGPDPLAALAARPVVSSEVMQRLSCEHLAALDELARASSPADRPPRRIVDKLPDNHQYLAWMLALFPNARILRIERDPRDVALSCWMTPFAQLRWANTMHDINARLRDYAALDAHWCAQFPGRFVQLRYSELVSAPEATMRRVLDALDLRFDAACLAPEHSPGLVRSASVAQVREPVHTRSLARWTQYAPYLPELFAGLG